MGVDGMDLVGCGSLPWRLTGFDDDGLSVEVCGCVACGLEERGWAADLTNRIGGGGSLALWTRFGGFVLGQKEEVMIKSSVRTEVAAMTSVNANLLGIKHSIK